MRQKHDDKEMSERIGVRTDSAQSTKVTEDIFKNTSLKR